MLCRVVALCCVCVIPMGDALLYSHKSVGFNMKVPVLVSQAMHVKKVLVGGSLLLSTPSFAQEVSSGEIVFKANCAVCHAGGQNAVVYDHTLEKEAIEKYLAGGFNEKAIVYQVTHGKNAMPAFSGRLSEQDISNVAAYVLRTAEEGWE